MADATNSTGTDIAALASLTPLIINMLKGSSQPNPGALLGTIPGGQSLLNGIVGQQQQQAPLRQAVTQQALNMLPGSAFPVGRPALSPVGAGPAPVASGGSGNDIGKLLAAGGVGAGLGALLSKLASSGSGGGGPLGDLLKKLFGHGSTPNGNTGQSNGLNIGPFSDNPYPDWLNTGTMSPTDRSQPTPSVSTDYNFNSDPNLGQGGGTDDAGGSYGEDGTYTPGEPSATWGG